MSLAVRAASLAFSLAAALLATAPAAPALAADAGPLPGVPRSYKPHVPKTAVHTEFIVLVNKKGQVTKIPSGKSSSDLTYNAITYGNALQVFVRTPDGKAVAGKYRLSYDFNPKTRNVFRSVKLIQADNRYANDPSAVDQLALLNRKHHPQASPKPGAIPDFKGITGHKH